MIHFYSDLFNLVQALADGDEDAMIQLDRYGLLAAPGEDNTACATRIKSWLEADSNLLMDIKCGHSVELDPGIKVTKNDVIASEVREPAAAKCRELYGFSVDWAPGFFLRSGVGLLWGGCAWHDEKSNITVFALRNSFRTSANYLVYNRDELIAHESCHAARSPFGNDWQLEEFFAYQTSTNPFRRYIGNCFVLKSDAILFLAPAFIVLLQQIIKSFYVPSFPWWPAWIIFATAIGYLLGRNQFARNNFFRAGKNLKKFYNISGKDANCFLFRCTWQEIKTIAGISGKDSCNKYLLAPETCDLRRKTAIKRFVPELMEVYDA